MTYLVRCGLSDDQNFAIQRGGPNGPIEVTFPNSSQIWISLKNRPYAEVYEYMARERAYTLRLADGALIQMGYVLEGGEINQHRLAFFSSPFLHEFQNYPELYLTDEIYADVVPLSIVPFPIRFDFSSDEGVFKELEHPKSHLSLGQYENCRIPVSGPVMPAQFMDFILRNFYHTAFVKFAEDLPKTAEAFDVTLAAAESGVIHVRVPTPVGH